MPCGQHRRALSYCSRGRLERRSACADRRRGLEAVLEVREARWAADPAARPSPRCSCPNTPARESHAAIGCRSTPETPESGPAETARTDRSAPVEAHAARTLAARCHARHRECSGEQLFCIAWRGVWPRPWGVILEVRAGFLYSSASCRSRGSEEFAAGRQAPRNARPGCSGRQAEVAHHADQEPVQRLDVARREVRERAVIDPARDFAHAPHGLEPAAG